jgi:hypothetical protein
METPDVPYKECQCEGFHCPKVERLIQAWFHAYLVDSLFSMLILEYSVSLLPDELS